MILAAFPVLSVGVLVSSQAPAAPSALAGRIEAMSTELLPAAIAEEIRDHIRPLL